ncbi:hypothetical protein AAF712_007889 [Marasmius tenuissimus]|uniref:Uncharacterized protein n=1 Tax=Marasmius tenuissimus TaxID=585030 RepID=A0ABR2ZUM5_9AGAR|nr:hypothetical protein PM082_015906 [Marasmius tenuissimus]
MDTEISTALDVDYVQERELSKILQALDLTELFDALREYGIEHDTHVRLLRSLSSTERREVLKGIPNVHIIDAYALASHLDPQESNSRFVLSETACHFAKQDNQTFHGQTEIPSFQDIACSPRRLHHELLQTFAISPRLKAILEDMGMEDLIPVAWKCGITDDKRLERISALDKSDLDELFNSDHLERVSPFYQRMLRLVLEKVHKWEYQPECLGIELQ